MAERFVVQAISYRAGLVLAGILSFVLLLAPAATTVRSTDAVDIALVLALDVSGSVNAYEYALQRDGLAAAFRDPEVLAAINLGQRKRIAVVVVQWAGVGKQLITVPWKVIGDRESAWAFSDDIKAMPRIFINGETHISGIIEFATKTVLSAPAAAARYVIDISGDGMDNVGYAPDFARNRALKSGVTINGLAILNETPRLLEYYHHRVIGGPNAFVIKANRYEDYAEAIRKKLIREISQHLLS